MLINVLNEASEPYDIFKVVLVSNYLAKVSTLCQRVETRHALSLRTFGMHTFILDSTTWNTQYPINVVELSNAFGS